MYDISYKLLQPAINLGLSEFDFWEMTVAEVVRYTEGATWRLKNKAQFDYVLADLIGASVSRIMSSEAKYPPIEEVYSVLFKPTDEVKQNEVEQEKVDEASANRFLQFALQHNARMRQGEEVT